MPAMILLLKRENYAVDSNRNHQDPSVNDDPFLPKAHERPTESINFTASEDDDAIWIPPEAADMDDEADQHVACTSSIGDDGRWREERYNAMLQAMSGQLRILAARFLASAGISFPLNDDDSSWLDIVTSLSWEAALLIKPDGGVGKEMDPGSYIKVKCVASGTRRQCEVIKGLVFKKSAAHKHMPTRCHNPRLLLLRGVLGDSHDGFSSFSSMEQEKDHLQKSMSKMMEMCSPNVIMVEKTVSRDILELLLKEGVTLVFDMKLSRLQRIARSSSSPILSFSEVLSKPKLKQCDYFHIEKIMEEHNHTSQVGKRTSKTLMFLEGFHKPSGCTILLRGANSEELKKVKQVMHYTVFAAYHLVLETSFFEDQRVFLNNKNASKEANSFSANSGQSAVHHEPPALPNYSLPVSPEDNDASALKLYPETCNGSVEKPTDGETTIISSIDPVALRSLNKGVPIELPKATDEVIPSERLA